MGHRRPARLVTSSLTHLMITTIAPSARLLFFGKNPLASTLARQQRANDDRKRSGRPIIVCRFLVHSEEKEDAMMLGEKTTRDEQGLKCCSSIAPLRGCKLPADACCSSMM